MNDKMASFSLDDSLPSMVWHCWLGDRRRNWIIHVSDASSISIGRILSPMMWFSDVRDNRSYQILSVNSACPSLVICAVPTPVKTTPELSGPAFGVLPKTGDEELEDRGKPGWERLRMICTRSTLAWRRQDGALWIDRHGVYSWMRLCPHDTLQREREREGLVTLNNALDCRANRLLSDQTIRLTGYRTME